MWYFVVWHNKWKYLVGFFLIIFPLLFDLLMIEIKYQFYQMMFQQILFTGKNCYSFLPENDYRNEIRFAISFSINIFNAWPVNKDILSLLAILIEWFLSFNHLQALLGWMIKLKCLNGIQFSLSLEGFKAHTISTMHDKFSLMI